MSTSYDYDEAASAHADDVANRIDQCGAFIGAFKKVEAVTSKKGTEGIHFEFDAPGGGSASFDCWTRKEDEDTHQTKTLFGLNQVQAMMAILGVRGLKAAPGKVGAYDEDTNKRIEIDGEVFPDLIGKQIGLVLQRENYSKTVGGEGYRMNLFGVFHPTSRLTASELKDRKVVPEKLEKMMRGLKTKDSRTTSVPEPAQPAIGAAAGGY